MKFKKFTSGLEMYNYIHKGNDLYSKSLGIYIFDYNDAGALCTYALSSGNIADVIEKSKVSGEYWSAHLGWYGSEILDDYEYNDDEHRYSDDWELNKLYLKPSLDFCERTYMADDWIDTNDVTIEYVLSE